MVAAALPESCWYTIARRTASKCVPSARGAKRHGPTRRMTSASLGSRRRWATARRCPALMRAARRAAPPGGATPRRVGRGVGHRARRADERVPLPVLLVARLLPDEHHRRALRPL